MLYCWEGGEEFIELHFFEDESHHNENREGSSGYNCMERDEFGWSGAESQPVMIKIVKDISDVED